MTYKLCSNYPASKLGNQKVFQSTFGWLNFLNLRGFYCAVVMNASSGTQTHHRKARVMTGWIFSVGVRRVEWKGGLLCWYFFRKSKNDPDSYRTSSCSLLINGNRFLEKRTLQSKFSPKPWRSAEQDRLQPDINDDESSVEFDNVGCAEFRDFKGFIVKKSRGSFLLEI